MGNPQHLEWLLEGVEAWNARRLREPFVPDLSGMGIRAAFASATRTTTHGYINLSKANLSGANLTSANVSRCWFKGADLGHAILKGAILKQANFKGAETRDADVRSTKRTLTDLSEVDGITQRQINAMQGDLRTRIPAKLAYPKSWHETVEPQPSPPERLNQGKDEGNKLIPPADDTRRLEITIRERSPADLRAALTASYSQPAELAAHMVQQLQFEIAAHKMTAIPNEEPALSQYNSRLNFLEEMRASVQVIHEILPVNVPAKIDKQDVQTIKDKLILLARQVQAALAWLDNDTGSFGNLWKLGAIIMATKLFGAMGFDNTSIVLPISAGLIGANTLRVIVQGKP